VLCGSGCYFQLIHGGGNLPAPVKVILFAPLLGEGALKAMVRALSICRFLSLPVLPSCSGCDRAKRRPGRRACPMIAPQCFFFDNPLAERLS
jgi:hypothetical protein